MIRRSVPLVAIAALVLALPAVAANIKGTSGGDSIRGTAAADRIDGRAGNDRLFGLGGDDVLIGGQGSDVATGGPGNDRLLLRDGTRDVGVCGPGRDTVVADSVDAVRSDCEVVQRPVEPPAPPPEPPPPPVAPVTPGTYRGLLEGNFLYFDILPDRTITRFRSNYIQENCDQGGYVYGTLNLGETRIPIANDGTFTFSASDQGTVAGEPATFTLEISGRVEGTRVTGSLLGTAEFRYQGLQFKCSSGRLQWAADLQT